MLSLTFNIDPFSLQPEQKVTKGEECSRVILINFEPKKLREIFVLYGWKSCKFKLIEFSGITPDFSKLRLNCLDFLEIITVTE